MPLLFSYLKQYKKTLFGALLLATINQVFSLLDPQIFRILIDNYATKVGELSRGEFLQGVTVLLLAAVGVAFVSRVAKNFQGYYASVVTQKVGTRLYAHSVEHSFSLPYAVFEDQRSGELLQKLQKARIDSQALIVSFIDLVFVSVVGITFVLTYAFFVHWLVGLLYILTIPTLGGVMFLLGRKIKAIQKNIVRESANLAGSTTETLRNVELVKSLGLETQETNRLNEVNDKVLSLELSKIRLIRKLSFTQGTLVNGIRSAIMFAMLWLIADGALSLGEFFSLLFYSFFIFNPLGEMGTVAAQYQEAKGSMETLEKILEIKPEEKPEHPVVIPALESLTFKKVGFEYQEGNAPALRDMNLTIKKGETVAFVGYSGSGKTTLVKLLVGLYRPTKGKLLLNGTDANTVDYEAFRRRIGYVSQETQLFAGTIRENLTFVNPSASDNDCWNALRSASVTGIAERGERVEPAATTSSVGEMPRVRAKGAKLDEGVAIATPRRDERLVAEVRGISTGKKSLRQALDTRIGEGGIKVSGGERQRLAIARALLRNPDLIIFDEATSSLDSITEKSITETIREIAKSRPNLITVMVAHRLSTIAHANTIYVLEKGKVIEHGTHKALLGKHGLYAALWREQSGGTS